MKLRKIFQVKSQSGFTLIELLVVIGILGILAAGLLLTIDPLEKFKQGNDTNSQQASIDLLNALTSFYSTHSVYPWDSSLGANACSGGTTPTSPSQVSGGFASCITSLINAGELKPAFASSNVTSQLYFDMNGQSPMICFEPQSKSMQGNAATKYNQNGTTSPACTAGSCYWCAQ